MEHREAYNHLVQSALPLDEELEPASMMAAVQFLLDYARRHQPLRTEAAWRLSAKVERALEAAARFRPTGGWANLVGLLAGTDYLQAKRDGFVFKKMPAHDHLSEKKLHVDLVEAMTTQLVPPATAASIFIALGIHPAWGLRLAWEVQNGHHKGGWTSNPPMGDVLPVEQIEPARRAVFIFVALVIGVLDRLETKKSYMMDAFAAVLEEAIQFARAVGECQEETVADEGLPCFLDGSTSNRRVMQVLARDLLEDVFIPAGVIRDVGDGRFAVAASVFGDVRIDKMDSDAPGEWFEAFLTAEGAPSTCGSEARR